MNASRATMLVCVLLAGLLAGTAIAVNIETVTVGNAGNAADTRYVSPGYGAVGYAYRMGKLEVTAGQYIEFLNAVARLDMYGLYDTRMGYIDYTPGAPGCNIQRSGSPGTYTYSVATDWANRPVNMVSWSDAARFANWMHNGQPTTGLQDLSTTEDGSYRLDGVTSDADLMVVTRKANATWVIPTEDEWYKAAYHKNDGVTGSYFDYPTSSNTEPSNALIDPDPGNNATFLNPGFTISGPYWRTEVGAHENSESPYGTFDQGGNVFEYTESVFDASRRTYRGGGFHDEFDLPAWVRYGGSPTGVASTGGFRLALVPEPAAITLLALGGLAAMRRRRAMA